MAGSERRVAAHTDDFGHHAVDERKEAVRTECSHFTPRIQRTVAQIESQLSLMQRR